MECKARHLCWPSNIATVWGTATAPNHMVGTHVTVSTHAILDFCVHAASIHKYTLSGGCVHVSVGVGVGLVWRKQGWVSSSREHAITWGHADTSMRFSANSYSSLCIGMCNILQLDKKPSQAACKRAR
jgi:hypothetical protein